MVGGHELEYYKTWGCGVEKGKSNIANCYSSYGTKILFKITAENFIFNFSYVKHR